MDNTKVYVVSHFEPLRLGLANIIQKARTMELVGEASSMVHMADDKRYRRADVVVIDMDTLNKYSMAALYQRLGEWLPNLKILFLGNRVPAQPVSFDDVPMLMRLDTVGFIMKDGPSDRLLGALSLVAQGASVCENVMIKHILGQLTQQAEAASGDQKDKLSGRETEVLTLVGRARSNREIAGELFLSEHTIKTHVSNIMNKLGFDRRAELVRYTVSSSSPAEEPTGIL